MELVVSAEIETGQLASDGPGPPTESPTTAGMAKTGLREPQAVFAMVTSQRSPALYTRPTLSQGGAAKRLIYSIPNSPWSLDPIENRHVEYLV